MFGRRVFASAPLPRVMWATLHIQNQRQAARMLPSLTPLTSLMGKSASSVGAAALPGLALNALGRTSAGVGEEGLVSVDGKLMGAEAAANACGMWVLSTFTRHCQCCCLSSMACSSWGPTMMLRKSTTTATHLPTA